MIIYVGEAVTVQVQGQWWRGEKCEHCGQPFHYQVRFAAAGAAANPYFIDSHDARRRAEEEARIRLDHALRHGAFPVPCPHCTLYQGHMVPAVRAEQYRWMRSAGRFLLGLTPTALLLGGMVTGVVSSTAGQDAFPAAAAVLLGLLAVLLSTGVGLLVARRRRQAGYDPNAEEYTAARRRAAATFALKPEEFARLGVPPTPAPPTLLGSPPSWRTQLVGQNCVRCGQRIPDDLDSRFCRGCGSPVDDRCAVPAEGGGCPVCGAGTPTR